MSQRKRTQRIYSRDRLLLHAAFKWWRNTSRFTILGKLPVGDADFSAFPILSDFSVYICHPFPVGCSSAIHTEIPRDRSKHISSLPHLLRCHHFHLGLYS